MKAMILAAGLGTRLRPLTNTIPKPLLPIAGTPLIVWNLLLLKQHGFRDVVINLHHLGPMIEQALGNGSRYGLRIIYSREPAILGTGGGIKRAEPHFSGESVLVLNGDTLVELDLGALCAFHQQRDAVATLVLRKDPEAAQVGSRRNGFEQLHRADHRTWTHRSGADSAPHVCRDSCAPSAAFARCAEGRALDHHRPLCGGDSARRDGARV